MDAEEGQGRIGHRVDQPADQVAAFVAQLPVLAAERDDARLGRLARRDREAVGLEAGAHDHAVGFEGCAVRQLDGRAEPVLAHAGGAGIRPDLATNGGDIGRVGARHRGEVGDRGLGRVERGDAGHVGLDLGEIVGFEPPQPGNAVLVCPFGEPPQRFELALLGRDDELAARVVGEVALGAVVAQEVQSAPAQPGLQRSGRVVDAGMHDAAVVGGLVAREGRLLLEHDDLRRGRGVGELAGGGEAEDAATDDHDAHLVESSGAADLRGRSARPRSGSGLHRHARNEGIRKNPRMGRRKTGEEASFRASRALRAWRRPYKHGSMTVEQML